MVSENLTEWQGKPVEVYDPTKTPDYSGKVYRIATEYDSDLSQLDMLGKFVGGEGAEEVEALIIGLWAPEMESSSEPIVEALVSYRSKLPKLRSLFIGDITYEEQEISWIENCSMAPLFLAYPDLEHFRVRGGNGLALGHIISSRLKSLIIETGGLRATVVHEIVKSSLPNLEHLEIWLGTDGYGANSTIEDVRPLLETGRFPKLKYLGLKNSDLSDELAKLAAESPMVGQLDTLDLSMGVLGNDGAEALVYSPYVTTLKKLDLHHHYIGKELQAKLKALPCAVDLSEDEGEDTDGEDRYVSVGE